METKINGRTPDEIKKGLECCPVCSKSCAYYSGVDCYADLHYDALDYIQQLERERDAAVDGIFQTCTNCKHEKLRYGVGPCPPIEEYLMNDCSNWQWCGVQEVE